jgi:CIC family chloride channel protein
MNGAYDMGLRSLAELPFRTFALGSLAIILTTSLIVGWLLTSYAPEAAGSGIPQLKASFWKDFGYTPFRIAGVKFVAGVLSIGGGSSLGREGPSVQLAGGVASNIARTAGEAKQNHRPAVAAGAAAGLAAAFNTPIAAVTFVLEEIVGDLNSRYLGGLLLASLIGAFVVHGIIGPQPAFELREIASPTWTAYALTPVVAALAAFVGVGFQRATIALRGYARAWKRLPRWLQPALGGLITWGLAMAVFRQTGKLGVFGLGYDDLTEALAGRVAWKAALLLLLAKFVATVACYGLGGCGGIFSPTLFFGGMVGIVLAGLAGWTGSAAHADMLTLAVVGMSATLGAVVRAPITGILIVFEMTHEFGLVPALMLAALVSQAISRWLVKHSFYDALLKQDGEDLEHVQPPRDLRSWHQLPVSAIANFKPVYAENLAPERVKNLLAASPYARFPVVQQNRLLGILTRVAAQEALSENRDPTLKPATTCSPTESIRKLQLLLIESGVGLVVVYDEKNDRPLGLVTLHDLLRAEMAVASKHDE